jgi:peptide methionine sulfoxide reductase MsrB
MWYYQVNHLVRNSCRSGLPTYSAPSQLQNSTATSWILFVCKTTKPVFPSSGAVHDVPGGWPSWTHKPKTASEVFKKRNLSHL